MAETAEEDVKTGDQTATEEASTQEESEQTEATSEAEQQGAESATEQAEEEGSSAKTETGKEDDQRIPKSRLDEVIGQREDERRRVQNLEAQLTELRSQVSKDKPKTWEDLSLDELERVRDHYVKEEDPDSVRFVEQKIIDRRVRDGVRGGIEELKQGQLRQTAWQAAVVSLRDFAAQIGDPAFDLSREDSRIRQLTVEVLSSEAGQRLQKDPEGPAAAAEIALARMLRERTIKARGQSKALKSKAAKVDQQTALESGGRPAVTTGTLQRQEEEAFNESDPRVRELKITQYLKSLEREKRAKQQE